MLNFYRDVEAVMNRIETKWQKYNYAVEHFPEITWQETDQLDLSPLGEVQNQLKLLDLPGVRYQQQRSTFSDLYMQIFNNGRFMIEVLNWWGGHVNVHDHDFSAVQFQLKGDALNVGYSFETREEAGALRFGNLSVHDAEIWKEGGRSIVRPGNELPHSVFHIGEPTTSLLIRTLPTPRFGAQSNYFPTLAANYYVANEIQRKKLTALSLLARRSASEFRSSLTHFFDTQSLSENFFMMLKLGPILFQDQYLDLISSFAGRGEREALLIESVAVNMGIDFFKTRANETAGLSTSEKLAAFSIAAAHSATNFRKIESDLSNRSAVRDLRESAGSFLEKLNEDDQTMARQYLKIFGMEDVIRGSN